jgi:RNA polymerase sigma-70 factor (ECF subfamily)
MVSHSCPCDDFPANSRRTGGMMDPGSVLRAAARGLPLESEQRERELIESARSGDETALERLLLMHHARLCGDMAARLPAAAQSIVSVDDVVQEAYVVVFQEIAAFRPQGPGSFYGWIATIAGRKLLDALKAQRTLKRGGNVKRLNPQDPSSASAIEWLEVLATYERTPSRSMAGREAIEAIQSAIGLLNPDYREALRLRYVEGLPVAEAAERMKRSPGALCLLCHRGLRQLEETLGSRSKFFGPTE